MADPLSIGASATGFLSLAITVTQSLLDYYGSIKDEEQRTTRLTADLEDLTTTLEAIQDSLDGRKSSNLQDTSFIGRIEHSIVSCREAIQDLEITLEKIAPSKQSGSGVRASFLKLRRQIPYPMRESTIFRLQKDISEMRQNLALSMEGLQMADTTNLRRDVANTRALIEVLQAGQTSSEILRWLNPVDSTLDHDKAVNERHATTGLWLVAGSEYKEWLTQPHPGLWLKGFAGCGKSVLCSTAIEYAIRFRRGNPRIAVAFFYFKFDDNLKRDLTALLRVLVLQLSQQLGNDFKELRQSMSIYRAGPPRQELERLFRELVRQFDSTYVLIDAVDESPAPSAREDVLKFLSRVRNFAGDTLHALVTSREERDIVETLGKSYHAVSMKNKGVDEDIALFVNEQLRDNASLKKWSAHRQLIEQALSSKANGVFRWVECQFISIRNCPVIPAVLKKLLDSLPQDLDKTYERMLENIPDVLTQYARKILLLLCFSERSLTVEEMIDAIAVDVETGFDPEMRCSDMQDILQICQGFVETFQDTHNFLPVYKIRIAHFSVQQYLLSKQLETHPTLSSMHLTDGNAQAEFTIICLKYLLDDAVSSSQQSIIFLPEYSFAGYAADHWIDHYHRAGNLSEVSKLAVQVFSSIQVFENLHEIVSSNPRSLWKSAHEEDFRSVEFTKGQLPFASRLYLADIISQLLKQPDLLDANGKPLDNKQSLREAFYQALQWRSVEVVRVLVQHLAQFDLPEDFWDTIDYTRAWSLPEEEIAQLLLEAGAPLAEYNFWKKNAERITESHSRGPTPKILDLLLRRGLKFEDQTDDQLSPFVLAARWGSVESMKHLIDRDYDVNVKTVREMRTPLMEAVHKGSPQMVKALLNHGADPNEAACSTPKAERSKIGDTTSEGISPPLAIAVRSKNKYIVKALLDHGASPVALTSPDSPLLNEKPWCTEEMVPLLVDRGTRIGCQEVRTALNAKERAPDLLQFILQNHSDLEASVLLEIHSTLGNLNEVQSLLHSGVAIADSQALFFAAKHGKVGVVFSLLAHGATLSADQFGAIYQCVDEIRALIDEQAEDCLSWSTFTPLELYLACRYSWKKTAHLLLDKGVDPNAIVTSHGAGVKKVGQGLAENNELWKTTPLGGAVASGDFDLVQAVVGKGGNIHACAESIEKSDREKEPCILEIGASTNDVRLVQYLINQGELEFTSPDGDRIKYWPGTLFAAIYRAVELDASDALEVVLKRTLGRLGDETDSQELARFLRFAAHMKSPAAAQVLLKRGAEVTEDTLVESQGQREMLSFLLQHYDLDGRVEERREYRVPDDMMLPVTARIPL